MYTDVDLYAKVRRAVMVDAMSERAAARNFGISRKTVSKMVNHTVPPGYQRKDRPVAPKLGAFVGIIHQILQDDRDVLKKQRHTAQRIFERLRDEHQYSGGYAKRPFAGPQAVLAYLSCYTHRVAIANSRLVSMDEHGVTFRWKDYRDKGATRHKTMTLEPEEFMRRFLLHVLPSGFHRIRHYGLIANNARKENLAHARELLHVAPPAVADVNTSDEPMEPVRATFVCSHCGAPMIIVQTFARGQAIRAPPHVAGAP